MVRNVWHCWIVKSWYEVEPEVDCVVFGRVREGMQDCVVYVKKPLTKKEALKVFDKAWSVCRVSGQIISLPQALRYFDKDSPFSDAFDYVHHFHQN